MDPETFRRVLAVIRRRFHVEDWSAEMAPFAVLVSVVLSQNTTVANERRALARLREEVGLTPEAVARAPREAVEDALRPAGLYASKGRAIQAAAEYVLEELDGDLGRLLDRPTEEARDALMRLQGVGPKTADVVLNMAADAPTMPVDTHIRRLADRWEIGGASYASVTEALKERIPPDDRRQAHLSLIRFGREICTARRPKCPVCPVAGHCPFYAKIRAGELDVPLGGPG